MQLDTFATMQSKASKSPLNTATQGSQSSVESAIFIKSIPFLKWGVIMFRSIMFPVFVDSSLSFFGFLLLVILLF